MVIADLLRNGECLANTAWTSEWDPLRHESLLQESQLLSVQLDAETATAAILLELRVSLEYYDEGNTGVLVARGVHQLTCPLAERDTSRTAWTLVGGGVAAVAEGLLRYECSLMPGPTSHLNVTARRLEFYLGNVPTLTDRIPDYGEDDDETIAAGIASWSSPFVVTAATTRDGSPTGEGAP